MGVNLPDFLVSGDPEVTLSTEGATLVGKLIGGVALATGIVAAGVTLYNRGVETVAEDANVSGVSMEVQ